MALDEIPENKLTGKQEAFCQAYLIDFNGAKAARLAGYAEESSHVEASRLLSSANIQARINELRIQMGKGFNITRERIAQELARIGFFDIRSAYDENGELVPIKDLDDSTAAAIAGIEVSNNWDRDENGKPVITGELKKIKISDKRAALDSLAKLMGYNEPDKLLLSGIKINVTEPDE